jgi:hypothetical protein
MDKQENRRSGVLRNGITVKGGKGIPICAKTNLKKMGV